jgi:hypothetical protein
MSPKKRFLALFRQASDLFFHIPDIPRNIAVTVLFLCGAFVLSGILITHTGGENNSALVFVLAVAMISLLTSGYAYGIFASIVGTVCINVFFMYPYAEFSLSQAGYPVAMLSMVAISCLICFLTALVRKQAAEAVRRERNTKALYELNEKLNAEKAAILYDFLDNSQLFHGTVVKEDRSLMNVPFVTGDPETDAEFVKAAEKAGFVNLKGHRTVGGMRASIYNAMPLEGVKQLVSFMKDFERRR